MKSTAKTSAEAGSLHRKVTRENGVVNSRTVVDRRAMMHETAMKTVRIKTRNRFTSVVLLIQHSDGDNVHISV